MPNLTINLDHIAPGVNPDRVVAWVECSAPNGWSDGSTTITLPDAPVVFDNTGAATVELKVTPTDVRYQVVVEYRKQGAGSRTTWRSGWFEFSANANLAALATVDIPGPPSTALSAFMATKGQPNGLATLDGAGKIPIGQMPTSVMTHEGTGNPNGTVTAPVGARFVNTEAGGYNGARVWRKDTGSGNTGWVVAEGDTGWRDISAMLINGWTGNVYVKRTPGEVRFRFHALTAAASTSSQAMLLTNNGIYAAPAGPGAPRGLLHTTADVVRRCTLQGANLADLVIANKQTADVLYGELTCPPTTTVPWPTTLPGTAV